ncbi:hypothetical protein Taro_047141, partial [Colocasia esculenta]|nr:hypothetical protein [Colocasia esculenta]
MESKAVSIMSPSSPPCENIPIDSKADSIVSPSSPPCENILSPPASTLPPASVPRPKRRSKHCRRIEFNLLEVEQGCELEASRKKRACVRSIEKSGKKRAKKRPVHPLISRCSMNSYCSDRDSLEFRPCHIELMRRTPFFPYVNNVPRRAFNISFVEQIILGWEGEDLFKFGRTIIPFTADDVALILGVPSVGLDVPINGPVQKSVLHSHFSNTEKFDREGIKKLIRGIIKSNETDDVANTVQLWILLLLSTFLAPRTNFTCPPQMLHCLDDLNRVKDFTWAAGFQKLILNKMGDAHEAAMNNICGVKTLAKRNYKSDLEGKRFMYGCSAALCMTPNNSCAQVWLLEHTRLQTPINKIVFPRILRWEGPKKRKVQHMAKNLTTDQILLRLIPHSEEEWLLSGLESSTKVVEGGEEEEEEEEEERREKKKEEDRKESEETGEMSPSKWSTVMSEICNELRGVVCRIEERDMQTRRELEEFGTKLDSLFKQLKSYMAERKSSTTAPQNKGKGMTNMGQTEEGRGSSTSPAPMDVDELEKVVQMAVNVGTLNREEEKEEYEVLAVEKEENPEATISIKHDQQLLESRRDFCGHDLLPEEQKQIVHSFLSQTIDWTKVMNNRWDGYVTRQHVHDILFEKVIVDDAINIGYQFLIEKMENSPNQHHTCTYTPALLVHSFQSRKAKIMER